jgi:hypothetical protein
MAGILKVDKYQDFNGNDIMTSDGSGNLTLNNAAFKNTPAFQAYLSSNQALSSNTSVKIQFDTEDYDTDNDYDNSTNYRFTISEAGKYYFYTNIVLSDSVNERAIATFKINGSAYGRMENYSNVSGADPNLFTAFSKNFSVNDYVEVFVEAGSSGATARSQAGETIFGGYKLIT